MDADILVIHQHRLILDLLEFSLTKQLPNLTVATQLAVESGSGALKPKLILIELEQLSQVAFRNLELLRQRTPGARVVILGSHARPKMLLARGVHTVIDLHQSLDDVIQRVSEIAKGQGSGMMVRGSGQAKPPSIFDRLSAREQEVLHELCKGLKSVEIASKLGICPQTVHSYVSRICSKLEVQTRQESVLLAMKNHYELSKL